MNHNDSKAKRHFAGRHCITLLIFLFFAASTSLTWADMDIPAGQGSWTYGAEATPVLDDYPPYAKPLGVGTVAESGDTVSVAAQLEVFSGPVDVYFALYSPSIDPNNIYILQDDNTFQPLAQGLVPWRKNVTGAISEKLFGDIPVSSLPSGTYSLGLLVTPAGSINTFYLWVTSFNNTPPPYADGILRLHPSNGRYFTDDSGNAIYLAGSHWWYCTDGSDIYRMSDADFEDFLDWLQGFGHNFTRLWTGWLNNAPNIHGLSGSRYDLNDFNQEYFNTIKERIQSLKDRGMFGSVMFFGSLIGIHQGGWSRFEYHPDKALQDDAFTTDPDSWWNPGASGLEYQKKQIRKFIDELHTFDNIIWEIGNEGGSDSIKWQETMAEYVSSYEKTTYGTLHPIGITGGYSYGSSMMSTDNKAVWVSPDTGSIWTKTTWQNSIPATSNKLVILDTDHLNGWGAVSEAEIPDIEKWVWKAFTRGTNPIFMDDYTGKTQDGIRKRLGQTVSYSHRFINLADMIPSSSASDCSTTYCLRNPGAAYLVYQPTSSMSFTVNLIAGTYNYEWFNPATGLVVNTGSTTVDGGNKSFTPSFSGDAVLYLTLKPGDK